MEETAWYTQEQEMEGPEVAKVMEYKYICEKMNLVEVSRFPVSDQEESSEKNARGKPKWKRVKSADYKRDENARLAIRQAGRAMNCNFGPEDYLMTLTYTDTAYTQLFAGMELEQIWEAARKQAAKTMEKVMRQARKTGEKVLYLSVTSDMDGKTGELVRVHHHVVVNGAGAELLSRTWAHGLVDKEHLYRQDDYTPLAAYLLGQVRNVENRKKYACSRNMEKPKIEKRVFDEDPEQEIRVQPGAKVLDRTPYHVGSVVQYVRYKRRPRREKRGGHKEEAAHNGVDKGGGGLEFSAISW